MKSSLLRGVFILVLHLKDDKHLSIDRNIKSQYYFIEKSAAQVNSLVYKITNAQQLINSSTHKLIN